MTYASLRAEIERYTGSRDLEFLASIDSFIRQAEARIGMTVEIPNYSKLVMVSATQNMNTTAVGSSGMIVPSFVFFPGYGVVEKKDSGFMFEAYPDATEMGPIRYFAVLDDQTLMWGPTPDTSVTGTMEVVTKWPSIVDLQADPSTANQETFISSRFETALLHGALYYAALWMKDAEMATLEKAEFQDGLGLLTQFAGYQQRQDAEKGQSAIGAKDRS